MPRTRRDALRQISVSIKVIYPIARNSWPACGP